MASFLHQNTPSSSFSSVNRTCQSTPTKATSIVATVRKNVSGDKGGTKEIVSSGMMDFDGERTCWRTDQDVGDPAFPPKKEIRPRAAYRSGLTPEKARLLRKELRATKTWHSDMYHSAIASRLACPDER